MKKYLKLTVLFFSLILLAPSLVACGDTVKGEGYEISNQKMDVTASGSEADVVIKGTLTNTLKEEDSLVVAYSILDEAGKRIAFAVFYSEDIPAGGKVDFETSLIPILPSWTSVSKDDYEVNYMGVIGLSEWFTRADKSEMTTAWGDVCQRAKSYRLEGVYFTKDELQKVQGIANKTESQLEQEKLTNKIVGK